MWISSEENIELGSTGVNDVIQCVSMLLKTSKGSVVLDRDLGLDPNIIDQPISRLDNIYQTVYKTIEEFEPRVIVKDIKILPLGIEGNVEIRVLISLKEGD